MPYMIDGFYKHAEEDRWNEGCIPETCCCLHVDLTFSAETKDALVNEIVQFFDVTMNEIQLDACEEAGRIDIQLLETDNSYKAYENELQEWKKGRLRLWLSTYTGRLQYLTDASFSPKGL